MNHYHQARQKLRQVLSGPHCLSPVSVFDPLSARLAQQAGFEIGLLAGSIASAVTITAPDLVLLTLTELAAAARRITRACDLALFVDADHGFGNALNVMRAVEELEHAGAAGLCIEDTVLPAVFGAPETDFISTAEMQGKLRAAVAARSDPDLVIAGRTGSLKTESVDAVAARIRAYSETGVDAIFIAGFTSFEQINVLCAATKLPVILGHGPQSFNSAATRSALAERGVRLLFRGHQPLSAALKAVRDIYALLAADADAAELDARTLPADELAALLQDESFRASQAEYLM